MKDYIFQEISELSICCKNVSTVLQNSLQLLKEISKEQFKLFTI